MAVADADSGHGAHEAAQPGSDAQQRKHREAGSSGPGAGPGPGLAAALRERINQLHGVDEPAYLRLLVAGALEPDEYAALLVQYLIIYDALDRAAEIAVRDDPRTACFARLGRGRTAVIAADLRVLLGAEGERLLGAAGFGERQDGAAAAPLSAALLRAANASTLAYRERILQAARRPGGFVAHHYVRYLADLSGGQLIGQALAREYGAAAAALGFHGVDDPERLRELKRDYRALLDAAPWSEELRRSVVDEAVIAYQLNTAVLKELGRVLSER